MSLSYSKNDITQMNLSFTKVFGVSKEVTADPAIQEWMQDAPVLIIEWDGKFEKEHQKGRDIRMQMVEVYDGDVHNLVEYLRDVFPEYRDLPKWSLIFTVANGIKDCQESIRLAQNRETFGMGESEQTQVDEPVASPSSSTEVQLNETHEDVSVGQQIANDLLEASGKAEETTEDPLYKSSPRENKEDYQMDENTMFQETQQTGAGNSALDELLNASQAADQGDGTPNFDQTQTPGGTAVQTTTGKIAMPKIQAEYVKGAQDALKADLPRRLQWSQQNLVTRIISKAEPSSLRIVDPTKGIIGQGEADARKKTIEKLMGKFADAVGVPSWSAINVELPLAERFPHVPGISDQQKAEQIYLALSQLFANPMAEMPVYVNDKPAWSICGFEVNGSDKLSSTEFRDVAMANSTGAVYAKGALVEGRQVNEGTRFVLTIAKSKENKKGAKGKEATTGQAEGVTGKWAGQIRVMNKPAFVENRANIIVVYPTVQNPTQEQLKYVGAKALIQVDGKGVAASFKYNVYNNGQPVLVDTGKVDKDGNKVAPKNKTKTFSLTLRTLTTLTESAPNAELGDATKYNVKPIGQSTRDSKDYTDEETLLDELYGKKDKDGNRTADTEAALVRLMAAAAQGVSNMKIDGNSAAVAAINQIKSAATGQVQAQEQRDAADVL